MSYKGVLSMMAMLVFTAYSFAQVTVKGKVTSEEDGNPLPGVTVVVKNTTKGTVTDIDGNFSIDVEKLDVELVFSYIGMESVTVPASENMSISMKPGVNLDEVIVTALGVERETKALGYSVTEVGSEELERSGEANVIQGLSSKVAGVQVVGSGGTPGASAKILIRGNSSFQGNNQPLIVIDGVPVNNDTYGSVAGDFPFNENLSGVNNSNRAVDINPDDIESVTVLKGPAAAALYGVRGANGVIMYTTKRGKGTAQKELLVDYTLGMQWDVVSLLPEKQTTYAQGFGGGITGDTATFNTGEYFADDGNLGTSNSWGPKVSDLGYNADGQIVGQYIWDGTKYIQNPDYSPGSVPSYNGYDEFFQTGFGLTNNLSIQGGNDKSTFRLSIGDFRQEGIIPNSEYQRTSFRVTTDNQLTKRLTVGATVNYTWSRGVKVQNGSNLSGVMLGLARNPAQFNLDPYENADGSQRTYFYFYDNPLWTVNKNPFTDNVNRFTANVNAKYDVADWFNITYRVGTDVYSDQRRQIFAIGSNDADQLGQVYENRLNNREFYQDLLLNFTKQFNENWGGRLSVGNNVFYSTFDDLYSRGAQLSIPGFYNLSNASDLYTSLYEEDKSSYAFFFDGGVDYKGQVFLNVTGRNEWHSTFGPSKNNFFYPAVNASWVFTETFSDAMPDWFSFGKVRAGYAQAGIAPFPYRTRTYYTSPTITDGFTNGISYPYLGQNGFGYSARVGNENLEPEMRAGVEFGADLRFFNGRLYTDITYYNETSSNLLLDRPIPPSSGFSVAYVNEGEMVNKGWEIMLGGQPIATENFNWDIMVNWSKNVNEVTKLAPGVEEVDIEAAFSSIQSYAIVGQPYGALYATDWQRDGSGNVLINPNTGLPMVTPEGVNIGNPFPDWLAGIRNTFTYKGVSLSFLIDIREGGKIWNGTKARMNRLGVSEESADRERTYVVEGVLAEVDGDGNLVLDDDGYGSGTSEANSIEIDSYDYFTRVVGDAGAAVAENVEDGSWVRLRDVNVSYRYQFDRESFFRYAEAGFTGRNLWISTDYTGVDPETSLTGAGSNVNGFDYFNNPGTRSYIVTLKLGF